MIRLLYNPKLTYPGRLYGVKIIKIRALEILKLGHLESDGGKSFHRSSKVSFPNFIGALVCDVSVCVCMGKIENRITKVLGIVSSEY